jgi:hypothetical protein
MEGAKLSFVVAVGEGDHRDGVGHPRETTCTEIAARASRRGISFGEFRKSLLQVLEFPHQEIVLAVLDPGSSLDVVEMTVIQDCRTQLLHPGAGFLHRPVSIRH